MNEADTCRKFIVPLLQGAGWDSDPHSIAEQRYFTKGRIVVRGNHGERRKPKRADYLLRYTRDFTIAVVEAKADYRKAADGVQQAKDYAQILGLKFAYASNGAEIIEFDFITGIEKVVHAFPKPAELWGRLRAAESLADESVADKLLAPINLTTGQEPHYYQQIAINRAVQNILQGKRRILLTMATGTGKTVVAFHICWKLWSSRWTASSSSSSSTAFRKPRILYLADRNFLVDDPKDKTFAPLVMPGTKSKAAKLFLAANCTSLPTNPSPKTKTGPACTRNSRPTSSISSLWTSAIAAARKKKATGARS